MNGIGANVGSGGSVLARLFKAGCVLSGALLLTGIGCVLVFAPPLIDKTLNPIEGQSIPVSERAKELHKSLFIVDMHADSLLWSRDISVRGKSGHVDVPRLIDANMAIQAFTVVTKVPKIYGLKENDFRNDNILLLAIVERWPMSCWWSLRDRVLYQADKLATAVNRSNGKLTWIKSVADLDAYEKRRSADPACTAGFMGIEGAHALDGDLANIDVFFDRGVRMMAPSHFFDNDMGGSSHGYAECGLTDKGKEMIRRMQAKSMIVDLAHASEATIKDVLAISTRPVVVSHTGVKGTCDNRRNLSDASIQGIAKTGGVVGIGYWPVAICGTDARAIARAIRYTANKIGVEHVALGSDFDGGCEVPFDVTGLPQITQALMDEHFTDAEIRAIMGGNTLRVLRAGLPAK